MSATATKTVKPKPTATSSRTTRTAAKAKLTAAPAGSPATTSQAMPKVVNAPQSVILGPTMRKKELVETVAERAGMKKRDARLAIEATLGVLGEALLDNRELNLPPFGKLKVRKERELPNGRMAVVKIRQTKPQP